MLRIQLRRPSGALNHGVRAVFQPRSGDCGRDDHLLPQMNGLPPRGRHQGIDSREQAPGAGHVWRLQASHHVELALQETEILRKATRPLLTPPLRLPLLIEIVRREKQPIENVRRVTEVRVLLVRAARRQRRTLQILGLVIEAAQRGIRARERRIDVRRALEIGASIVEQRAGLLRIGRAGQLPAPIAQRAAQFQGTGVLLGEGERSAGMREPFLYEGRIAREPDATFDELAAQHDRVDPLRVGALCGRQHGIGAAEERNGAVHLACQHQRFPMLADPLGLLHKRPGVGASRARPRNTRATSVASVSRISRRLPAGTSKLARFNRSAPLAPSTSRTVTRTRSRTGSRLPSTSVPAPTARAMLSGGRTELRNGSTPLREMTSSVRTCDS